MIKITERGWAGHFICADRCMFRRNTLIEYKDIKIVVSTVGNMRDYHAPDGFNRIVIDEIGYQRYFETMAFHAKFDGTFWDADVTQEVRFEANWAISEAWKEFEANNMHEDVVKEISEGLLAGNTYKEAELA